MSHEARGLSLEGRGERRGARRSCSRHGLIVAPSSGRSEQDDDHGKDEDADHADRETGQVQAVRLLIRRARSARHVALAECRLRRGKKPLAFGRLHYRVRQAEPRPEPAVLVNGGSEKQAITDLEVQATSVDGAAPVGEDQPFGQHLDNGGGSSPEPPLDDERMRAVRLRRAGRPDEDSQLLAAEDGRAGIGRHAGAGKGAAGEGEAMRREPHEEQRDGERDPRE